MKKELLTVGKNGQTQKFFIMGNHGQLPGTPYFDTLKECMVELFRMSQGKGYTNIYDMTDNEYQKEVLGL